MNNSDFILDYIEKIASNSSKKEKERLIKEGLESIADFEIVLKYAYDPFIIFGIQPQFPYTAGESEFTRATWDLLTDLMDRRLTGNAAREALAVEFANLTPKSADLLWRIIRKDLRAGFSGSTINKAAKSIGMKPIIPTFPYMRCCLPKDAKLDKFSWGDGVFSQVKADGMFANINLEDDAFAITSRNGSPFPAEHFAVIEDEMRDNLPTGYQYHGEFLVYRNGQLLPREQGNGIMNSVLKGGEFEEGEEPVFVAWDMIPLSAVEPKGKHNVPYKERFAMLMDTLNQFAGNVRLVETQVVHSLEAAYTHYRECLARGEEGTIIKNASAPWRDGTSKDQVKLKLEVEVDLEIVDFLPGEGKNAATFGSILVKSSDDLLEVAVSGFSDAKRKELHEDRENVKGKIMTVRANAIMVPQKDGDKHSMFLPRHIEIREDKTEADSLQRVKDQFEAAISAQK